ncbi:MAG: hypothetical protein FH753_00035 [Firmicutes bacterium]|nr:hypothetical protein [Bacillota bacterium]
MNKKKDREMTDTEYWGYKKYHKDVKYVLEREKLKANDTKKRGLKKRNKLKQKIEKEIQKGNYENIDDILDKEKNVKRKMNNAKSRMKRKKLLEKYEK